MLLVVHYLHHSGWLIELEDQLLIIDYWRGELPRFVADDPRPLLMIASHAHGDHYNPKAILPLLRKRPNTRLILSSDITVPDDLPRPAIVLAPGDSAAIGPLHIRAFDSSDAGISLLLRTQQVVLFHAGDFNLWHWPLESTPTEIAAAEASFERILVSIEEELSPGELDLAFFPVDARQGADFDRGARLFCQRLQPKHFFAMHFLASDETSAFHQWICQELPSLCDYTLMPQEKIEIAL